MAGPPGCRPDRIGTAPKHPGGRPRGSRNKIGAQAKDAILATFMQLGGVKAMTQWARRNRTEFYTKLYVRLLPFTVNASVKLDPSELSEDELIRIVARGRSGRTAGEETSEPVSHELH
jgi:hypothetical protein